MINQVDRKLKKKKKMFFIKTILQIEISETKELLFTLHIQLILSINVRKQYNY